MKKKLLFTIVIILLMTLLTGVVQAQDEVDRGAIQGLIYEDVNGDGQCVNTGVEGEGPIEGVNVEFVSSDEKTIINHYSGPEGIYGLMAAGHSYWRITAKPDADWVVTSENPLYVPIGDNHQSASDVNFCVQKANTVSSTSATVILPQSGASYSIFANIAVFFGLSFVFAGLALEWNRRRSV